MKSKKKIILGVTGSIAAFKAAEIVSRLLRRGFDVIVVMTEEAKHFITPLTLQMISKNKVYSDMFEVPDVWDIEHVSLAERADLVLIAPATASMIGKLAAGVCDDLLTCLVTAARTKILIAPAMNEKMWTHKITQENVERLKKVGYKFVAPARGRLACGKVGIGRLVDVDEIVAAAARLVR